VLSIVTGDVWVAVGSAALCGACIGFLPHNLANPARIFLGDGGSMPLGFIVAILTASAAERAEPSLLALMTGLVLVGIPALDTTLVMISRRRRGVSILTGGHDHLTHRTQRRMHTARRVALVLGGAQALASALVVVATRADSAAVVYVVLGFVICAATAIISLDGIVTAAPSQPSTAAGPGDRAGAVDSAAAAVARIRSSTHVSRAGGRWIEWCAMAVLAILGLGAGLSPLFSAYYSQNVWVPLGLALVVAAAAAAIARPPRLNTGLALALTGIAGLGLWSLLSTSWAQAVEQAIVGANLWLAYGALLLLLAIFTRTRRRATLLLVAVGVGIAAVGVSVLVRMLGGDPAQLFLGGRLNSPLGYINGEGCVFAMGCWLSLALAERRQPVLAGLGAGATVALACLTLMSQSRGAAIASLVAIVVALVAVPGLRRRVLALATVAVGVTAAAPRVLHIYSVGQSSVPAGAAHSAAAAVLLFSAACGVAWGVIVAAGLALERNQRSVILLRRCATILTVVLIAAPLVAAAVTSSSIERIARQQWHAFVDLSATESSPAGTQTRLLSGSGNRYDYWRVAWHVFKSHPIAGVGAGNYTAYYYRERRTTESIQNPHSIELQTVSELGVVGAVLLALLIAGVALGARALRRVARHSSADRTILVASVGVVVVWLVDTSGDWIHLLPGVTAIALAAAATLCRGHGAGDTGPEPQRSGSPLRRLCCAAVGAFVLVIAGASLLRLEIVQRYVDSAQSEIVTRPASAIRDAQRALRLDGENLAAYYAEAAGEARFDRAGAARSLLLSAAHDDPHDFVTWVLLGDLEVRLRAFGTARQYYGAAHALDPTDPALSELTAHPASALASSAGS
jgi:hypothetical protein